MGLILDLIGGMASAGGEMMGEQRKMDMQTEKDRATAADTEQRQMRVEKYRAELEEKKLATQEALKEKYRRDNDTRLADQGDKIVSQGEEIGKKRDVKSMTLGAAGLPFQGEFSGQEIKSSDIESMPPAARKIYEEQGFLPKRTGSGIIADQMTAARTMGADPTLRTDLQKQYGTEREVERRAEEQAAIQRRLEQKTTNDEVKAAETERSNRAREELRDKQIAAAIAKSSDGSKLSREERIRYTSLLGDAGRRLDSEQKTDRALAQSQKDALSKQDIAKLAEERAVVKENIRRYSEERSLYQSLLAESGSGKSGDKPDASAPKPDADKKLTVADKPPSVARIRELGAPVGSTVGGKTAKGWEVLDENGVVRGHMRGN